MKLFYKILLIAFLLALLFAVIFAIWGDTFERIFSQEASIKWFMEIKPYAWIVGICLLITDLVLPVPATGIMAALGNVYGLAAGCAISVVGSAGAGFSGYLAGKYLGRKKIGMLASEEELNRFQELFNSWGGGAIIVSRILPIMPEVTTVLAGLSGMNMKRFTVSLLLGTVPVCFLFSLMGHHTSGEAPGTGIFLAVVIPLLLWPIFINRFLSEKK